MSRRKRKSGALRVRAEETVGGVKVVRTAGLPSSLKAFVRTCVKRYPDLLPACKRLVVGWNILGGHWPALDAKRICTTRKRLGSGATPLPCSIPDEYRHHVISALFLHASLTQYERSEALSHA